MSAGSSIAVEVLFIAHRCSFEEGIGAGGFAVSADAGMRKGSAPLGDA